MNPYLMLLFGAVAGAMPTIISRFFERGLDRRLVADTAVAKRLDEMDQKIQRNQEAVIALQTTAATQSPFFTELQSRLIDSLHHPDPRKAELDALLEKLKALRLDAPELQRLQVLLREQALDPTDPVQQKQSHALLAIMPLVLDEAKEDIEASLREAAIPVRPTEVRPTEVRPTEETLTQLLDLAKDIQTTSRATYDTLAVFVDRRDRRSTDPIAGTR